MKIIVLISFFLMIGSISYSQSLFKEVSDSIGLDYIYPGNQFQMAGSGLVVIDVNNDGWEDLFQCGGVFDSKLWINNKGKFIDRTKEFGLDVLSGYFINGAATADYNNDGFQDFVITNFGNGLSNGDKKYPVILKNIQGKSFRAISLEGIVDLGYYSSASWGDINKDGYSDIYITNYLYSMGGLQDSLGNEIGYDPKCGENILLINQKGESFIEAAKSYGVSDNGCGLASLLVDIDNDNDLDILLLNDFGMWSGIGNKYFQNNYPEKSFSDKSIESGFNKEMYGMGLGYGDINKNGDLEFYVTNIGDNALYQYTNEKFSDLAAEKNLEIGFVYDSVRGTSWSGLFFDLEFDGDLDLFVSKGNVAVLTPPTAITDHNKLFVRNDDRFIDSSANSGLNDGLSHRGSAIFDFDHDGDLDIVSSVAKMPWSAFGGMEQKIKLYRNDCKSGNFIGVKLVGLDEVNRNGYGAKVFFGQNGTKSLSSVDSGSGHASQSTQVMYYGLGMEENLETLHIEWPDGESHSFTGLRKNTVYEINSNGELSILYEVNK